MAGLNGIQMLLKTFGIEIDPGEIKAGAERVGKIVDQFDTRLHNIETVLVKVSEQLDRIENGRSNPGTGIDTPAGSNGNERSGIGGSCGDISGGQN